MQETILLNLPINDFKLIVIDALNSCLSESQENQVKANGQKNTEIIDRDELCKRLNVSPPTIKRMEKKGKLPRLEIGSAIRYDWTAVLKALENK